MARVADGIHRVTKGVVNFYLSRRRGNSRWLTQVRRATGRRLNGSSDRSVARWPIWMNGIPQRHG